MSTSIIETVSGILIDPLDPSPHQINLQDIAWGLANTCRWAGQTRRWFSVAQHCCMTLELAQHDSPGNPGNLWQIALLHDAAEAYLGDTPKPVKDRLVRLREVEARLFACVLSRFGLMFPDSNVLGLVTRYDAAARAIEARMLYKGEGSWWRAELVDRHRALLDYWEDFRDKPAEFWGPDRAREEFLQQCEWIGIR